MDLISSKLRRLWVEGERVHNLNDEHKTKKQFINELKELRKRISELEKSEIERKQTEERWKKTMAEADRSNTEVKQLVYLTLLGLQEPLRMVSTYTELLGRCYKDKLDANANEFIAYAVGGARHMQKISNDLLRFFRNRD